MKTATIFGKRIMVGILIFMLVLGSTINSLAGETVNVTKYSGTVTTTTYTDYSVLNYEYTVPNLSKNLIAGLVPSVVDSNGTTMSVDCSSFVDGWADTASDFQMPTVTGAVNVTYDLKIKTNIKDVLLAGSPYLVVALSNYEIYVSDTQSALYDASNKVLAYANYNTTEKPGIPADNGATNAQRFSFDGSLTGRFIGIKLLGEFGSNGISRITQLGVYGNAVATETYMDSNVNLYTVSRQSRNMIAGLVPTVVDSNGTTMSVDYSSIVDGWADTACDFQMPTATGAVNISYDLKSDTNIKTLVVAGSPYLVVALSNYEIYVSNTPETLYNASSKVFAYANYNSAEKPSSSDTATNGVTNAQRFSFGGNLTGRYIGFRLLGEIGSNAIARITQLGVYGTAAATTTFSDADAVNVYTVSKQSRNLIVGLVPTVVDSNGTTMSVNYTSFADGWADTACDFQMPTSTGAVKLSYDLQTSKNIKTILLSGSPYLVVALSNYEIYVSDTQETLYNSSNRVLAYDNYNTAEKPTDAAANGATVGQMFAFSEGLTCRYIGIKLLGEFGTNAIARITQLAIYDTIPTTGVSLSQSSASLLIGNNISLVQTVSPLNATNQNVSWSSSNENVAIIDSIGNVTAVAAGTSTITVSTVDGNITATCDITVLPFASFDNYNVSISGSNIITNIQPGTTVEGFLDGVTLNGGATLLVNSDIIATGVTIDVMVGEDNVGTYTIVIYGDVDGDGTIGLEDLTAIRDHLLETTLLEGTFKTAGNLYGEGDITLNDLVGLMAHESEAGTISQDLTAI